MRPAHQTQAQGENAAALREAAASVGDLHVEEVVAPSFKGHESRRTNLIDPSDLHRLYTRCHRAHVWVAQTAGVDARLDPSDTGLERNKVSLQSIVQYKCVDISTVSRPHEAKRFVEAVSRSLAIEVDSVHDPRCLPLHCFSPYDDHDLLDPESRDKFIQKHRAKSKRGAGRSFYDVADREWQSPQALHSADELHVRGFYLPTGFHWDVQTGRRRMVFANGWDTWETVNEAHLNVHPDGHVRATHATRTWSWEDSVARSPRQKVRQPRAGNTARGRRR